MRTILSFRRVRGECEIMKAMMLGVGAVGSVTAEILANSQEFDQVILADLNLERAKRKVKKIDASDVDGMAKAFKGVDIVLNGVIPRFNLKIMDACLQAKANYADMA